MSVLQKVGVLFVSPHAQDARELAALLGRVSIPLNHVIRLKEAKRLMHARQFGVVLTEGELGDGSWLDVLRISE